MNALEYACELIKFDSVSSKTNRHVSDFVQQSLGNLGFRTERIDYQRDGIIKVNVIGCRDAANPCGGIAFFGHTDVVPADDWSIEQCGPFEPNVDDGRLYGRGSTDMKGSIACILAAAESIKDEPLEHPVYVCSSADEELDHRGIQEVISRSSIYQELIAGRASGIVGEPTEMEIVYAHKGGVQIVVTSHGFAAHTSTGKGTNANLAMIPFLSEMKELYQETESERQWRDEEFEPPTICLNLGINDHTEAVNVTPAKSICTLCLRSMPKTNVDQLVERIRGAADRHGLEFKIVAQNPPFRRAPDGEYVRECARVLGKESPQTVAFGTEAGNLSALENLVVLGPGSIAQAHKSDEWISLKQLAAGEAGYLKIIQHFCQPKV